MLLAYTVAQQNYPTIRLASMSAPGTATPHAGGRRDVGRNDVLATIEQAMIRIRRRQTRRALSRQLVERTGAASPDVQQLAVIDAVEEGPIPGIDGVTVGMIAERTNMDPSRASRVVAEAIGDGLLLRVASQSDGRRTCIELTPRGRQVAGDAHRTRRAYYAGLMKGWSAEDRAEFARLLDRFAAAMMKRADD
jgi:DNA-binding MarR family transcriptional regulator